MLAHAENVAERNRLLLRHRGLVVSLAARMRARMPWLDLEELISVGTEAMLRSWARFDAERGVSFATFASHRVRGAMLDLALAHKPTQELPEMTEAANDDTHAALEQAECRERLYAALARLPARKRQLLEATYYGDATLEAAGAALGISKSWACRMHGQALAELRGQLLEFAA